MTLQQGPKLIVIHGRGYISIKISHGNGMMLLVI